MTSTWLNTPGSQRYYKTGKTYLADTKPMGLTADLMHVKVKVNGSAIFGGYPIGETLDHAPD